MMDRTVLIVEDSLTTRAVVSILRARASALAQRQDGVAESAAVVPFAAFVIGGHGFGIPLQRVLRAAELRHLTEIPGGPGYLLGIAAIEGRLVSLLDLAA